MYFATFGTGQVFWSMLWFFLWFIWIWLLIIVFSDIFRSQDLSGWGKALWTIFVIFLPYLGVFIYLIANGHGMGERAQARAQQQQTQMDDYVRSVASSDTSADQIAKGKQLLDSGAITQAEFDTLKAKALAT